MKNYAVICEFNPFHSGHEYLISKAKEECDTLTAIMSGDFTERGEGAVISKYERARAAILGGADLVIELPFPYSASGSESFAFAGVDIAERLGFIDGIVFGSECGDGEKLKLTAENIFSEKFQCALSENLKTEAEKPYGKVYFETYNKIFGYDGVFSGSNDILAVAYISEMIKRGSALSFLPVKRQGEAFGGGGNAGFCSAATIRKTLLSCVDDVISMLPDYSFGILKEQSEMGAVLCTEKLFLMFVSFLLSHSENEISFFAENNTSLAKRLIEAAHKAHTFEEFYALSATKKYSVSRLRRALLFSFFGITREKLSENPAYTLLLAANRKGCELLSAAKKSSSVPIITKPADYIRESKNVVSAFEKASGAAAIWALSLEKTQNFADIMRKTPYIL